MNVSMQNSAIKALIHFWDPEYWFFTFRNVDLCPTLEEYGLLTEFPRNLYKVLIELIKVIGEKCYWPKMEDDQKRKNDSRFVEEKGRILPLAIYVMRTS